MRLHARLVVTAALAQSSLGKQPPVPNPSGSQRDGLAANQS